MKIYAKIHAAKQEIGVVKKNAKNPHFKNTYADLNALIEAVEPILLDKGLILLQPIKDGKVFTQIIDIDSFEMVESNIELTPNLTAQALGSQITYYRRYQISAILSLMSDDDDGQKASAPQAITKPICSAAAFEKAIDIVINEFTLIKKEMTAKEKSEHLIRQMTVDFNIDYNQSVLCAIICCDEVLDHLQLHDIVMIDYWDRVKEELIKL